MNASSVARLHAEISADTRAASRNLQDFKGDLSGAARAAESTGGKLGGLTKAAGLLGGVLVATQAVDLAAQLFEIGDASLKAERGLEAVAGGAQAAADITAAVKEGSSGLLTAMDAQVQATRLLSLGIASTAEEAGHFTNVAATLGAVIGKDATASVEQLSLAIANMSVERLDALGISAGAVRARIAELKLEGYAADEAFKMATMEQAAIKMDALAAAGFTAGTSLERLKVRAGDAAAEVGERLAGALLGVADRLEASEPWFQAVNQRIYDMGEQANIAATNTLHTADSMGWLTDALYNSNPAFASTYNWAVMLTGAADDVATAASNVPPNMARIEGSSYGAAGGMRAAANEALVLKDALDRLNNSRTGNLGRTAASGPAYGGPSLDFNDRMEMQDAAIALGYGGSAGGRTQNYDATTAHELDLQRRQLEKEARERAEALRASMVTGAGGGQSYRTGGGGGGGGGIRSAGAATGAAMATDFAGGMSEGFSAGLDLADDAAIRAAVVDFITDNRRLQEIRDELTKDLGSTIGATGAQVDLALTDLFGARATPIDSMVTSMATAAEQNAVQLQEIGSNIGKSIETGLETRFDGIGDRIVGIVLDKLAEAA